MGDNDGDAAGITQLLEENDVFSELGDNHSSSNQSATPQLMDMMADAIKTAVTEASRVLPSHVVCAYFGHSEKVSKENYRMVTEVDAANFSSLPFILKMEDAA